MLLLFFAIINRTASSSIAKRSYYNPPQLPEIIINRAVNSNTNPGYIYQPPPSIVSDIIPTYGPPQIINDIIPAFGNDFRLDIWPKNINSVPSNSYLPPSKSYGIPKTLNVKIINMTCQDTTISKYFTSFIQFENVLENAPVIDDSRSNTCLSGSGQVYQLNIQPPYVSDCGIAYCSDKKLCIQLRVPAVKGLKLPEDFVISLQCKPQSTIATQTKHLLIKPQALQGRSLGTIAVGGTQRHFEVQVALYRKSLNTNEFTQIVTPGSSVHLGEDLLIKAGVKDGDGWQFTRLGAVVMQQGRLESRRSVILVDDNGCRVNEMKSICPEDPRQVNHLLTILPFRAFLFQGTEPGDEMVLTVRMFACVHQEDCLHQTRHCEEKVQGRTRAKREMKNGTSTRSDGIRDWESHFDFKVILPNSREPKQYNQIQKSEMLFLLSGLSLLIISILLLFIVKKRFK